jgi:hypothetical protein
MRTQFAERFCKKSIAHYIYAESEMFVKIWEIYNS